MQKISPCLWFDKNCEEAINFYVKVFPNSKINSIKRYPDDMQVGPIPDMAGKVLTAIFELDGLTFQALDGGPIFTINPSISCMVSFDPAQEDAEDRLDAMWAQLSEGGKVLMPLQEYPFSKKYGWIQDRFGMSWQLILIDSQGGSRQRIIPSLLFVKDVAGRAEEALNLYISLFKNSKMNMISKYPAGVEPDKEGSAMYAEAQLDDTTLIAMDSAGPHEFAFSEAISLSVTCEDQAEVDHFWNKLTADGGQESECGWLKDKFGVSWQIIPKRLGELLGDPDQEKSGKALQAMLGMKKIDVAELEKAFAS